MQGHRLFNCATLLLVFVIGMAFSGCAKKEEVRTPVGIMDQAIHHYNVGMNFLDNDKLDEASQSFQRALELEPQYGPALAGSGLVLVIKGADQEGFKLIQEGQSKAKTDDEKIWTFVSEIRAHTALAKNGRKSEADLIKDTQRVFNRAKRINPESAMLHFYQGEAAIQALDFTMAVSMFAAVKSFGRDYVDRADRRWEMVQKAERAAPGTLVGRRIALVDKITRADLAGLLVAEMNVEKFYERTQEPEQSTFQAPQGNQMSFQQLYKPLGITDIADHPLRANIEAVINLGVKGMEAYPDHTFQPQVPMSKAEVAMIFEDVIVRATGKTELATRFIGQASPFPDVRNDHPYFNAVMLCTSRGLMQSEMRTGLFKPMDPVSGVDALLAIKQFKQELSFF